MESSQVQAGALCLGFANTLEWRNHPQRRHEKLGSYADLVNWARDTGLISAATARKLARKAAAQPHRAEAMLERARSLRHAIYRLLSAVAARDKPDIGALALLNSEIAVSSVHGRLVAQDGEFRWDWAGAEDALEWVLWPVTRAAAELLTSQKLDRLRECEGEGCGWMFIDTTRNRSRRWCDMKVCGNRAKVRTFYKRHRRTKK